MEGIIIIGAGGLGRETAQLIRDINHREATWDIVGFLDDDIDIHGRVIDGIPVLGGIDYLNNREADNLRLICAIGNTKARRKITDKTRKYQNKYANIIHPSSNIGYGVKLGQGVVIGAGCVISVNVEIGDHAFLNPMCGIGHDAIIKPYSMLLWGVKLGGNTLVGEGCKLGSSSVIIQQRQIGAWSTVGAGAVVTKDISEYCTAVGVPARII
ncbi:MAG: acetyltransferase [Ignavibacteriales bacterium]